MSGRPWEEKKWAGGRIEDESRHAGCILVGLAVVWNLVAWGVALPVVTGPDRDPGRFVVLLFPTVGIVIAGFAVYFVKRRRRFGSPVLQLATLPGVIGRALAGEVRIERGLDPESDFALTLKCVRTVVTGSGKHRKTRHDTLWESAQRLPGALAQAGGLRLPVAFAIPAHAEPTDERDSNNKVRWYLEVRSEVPGVDFAGKFEVPVFHTAESATPLTEEERRLLGG